MSHSEFDPGRCLIQVFVSKHMSRQVYITSRLWNVVPFPSRLPSKFSSLPVLSCALTSSMPSTTWLSRPRTSNTLPAYLREAGFKEMLVDALIVLRTRWTSIRRALTHPALPSCRAFLGLLETCRGRRRENTETRGDRTGLRSIRATMTYGYKGGAWL